MNVWPWMLINRIHYAHSLPGEHTFSAVTRAVEQRFRSNIGVMSTCSNDHVVEKLNALLSKQNKGLGTDERAARLLGLERIANAVSARRSRSEEPRPTPESPR